MKTVLFVGAGHDGLFAVERGRQLGLRAEVIDVPDESEVRHAAGRHSVDGLLALSDNRAVAVVAAVAEDLDLPGIGRETAHLMTHKVAMRRRLAERGVAQPEFAAVRTLQEARTAAETIGLPAVVKPANSGGRRGLFLLQYPDELEARLHAALAESPSDEAIIERYHDGLELTGLAVVRTGHVVPLALSDRLRPPGSVLGVGSIHVYPTTLFGDALSQAEDVVVRAVHALGLRDGLAFPQLLVSEDGVRVLGIDARIPDRALTRLAAHALGLDLVEIALRLALGESVPDELVTPGFQRPLAIQYLTAEPGPLTAGTVRRIGSLEKVLAFPGVVEADIPLAVGQTIDPVRLDGDRHGYVIATGETNLEAVERAEAAARLVDVEVW